MGRRKIPVGSRRYAYRRKSGRRRRVVVTKLPGGKENVRILSQHALFWKGVELPNMDFTTKAEAITARRLKYQQMELAKYSPQQLDKFLKIKKTGR